MRILLYEHITALFGGAAPAAGADSLHCEGWAMRQAVATDLARIDGVDLVVLDSAAAAAFRDAAKRADAVLVIAPEFEGILAARCQWVEEAGVPLLGPDAAAVRLAADKFLLAAHWQAHGVPTPAARLHLPGNPLPSILPPVVCKPRFGAGSQATFLIRTAAELPAVVAAASQEIGGDLLLQPFVPGQPASVAWLVGPTQSLPLLPARQTLSADGRFHYHGGQLPLDEHLCERAIALSRQALACVPGLQGYVGVDLVLGAAADGSGDQAIELNPRLTTSYVGLRTCTTANLAALMLQVGRGEPAASPTWHPGTVQFTPAGEITCEERHGWPSD